MFLQQLSLWSIPKSKLPDHISGLKYIHIYFFCITVVNYSSQPWVFYLSTRDVLSDVFLTGTTGTTGHAWQHGRLAGQNWIASATSPIYASSHTPHGILFEVWYINLNRQWVSVGLQTNGVWRSLTQWGISYVQVLNGKFEKGDARTRSIVELEIGITPSD